MNKLLVLTIGIFITSILVSCKSKDNEQKKVKKLNLSNITENLMFTKYFNLKKIIKLETTKNCLIGDIDKILFLKDRIFVIDILAKSIWAFNYNGNYLFQIKHLGKGPGEYINIGDVDVNEKEGTVLIIDRETHKIIKYNLNGKFLNETTCKFPVAECKTINKSFVYYFRNSSKRSISAPNSDYCYNLFIEKNGNVIFKGCPFYKELRGFYYHTRYSYSLVSSNNYLYVLEPLSNTIYKLSEKELIETYKVDFGKFEMPENIKRSRKKLESSINEYSHSIRNIYEDSTILFFMYNEQNFPKGVIFDKTSYKPKKCDAYEDDVNGLPLNLINVQGLSNNMVSLLEPTAIIDYYKEMKNENKHIPQILNQLINNINSKDNPIIIIYEKQNIK